MKSSGSTTVVEHAELSTFANKADPGPAYRRPGSSAGRSLQSHAESAEDGDRNEILPPPITTVKEAEHWNSSRLNVYKVFCTFWSFLVMGANDATYGAILPSLERYYDLSYIVVSLVFLSPFVGYTLAAVLNNTIHLKLGQRGIAYLTPICHLVAYVVIAVHPPYPVLVIAFIFAGLGNGFADSAWNAWIGDMANANEVLGFLHGAYGLGALIAPLIATAMITKGNLPWYYWYYCMIGFSVFELVTSTHAFWAATGAVFRAKNPRTTNENGSRLKEAILRAPAARVSWLAAAFLLCYVGIEVALGGWVVTFMLRERDASDFASGMTATGFWLGITIGRLVLGFMTPRIGERVAVAIYIPMAMALELVFWLVPNFHVGAVAVAFVGFFLGPLFPAAMVACTKLLPKHLHISSIGFSASCGGSGGAIFPFAVGAVAQAKGVQVLQPIIVSLLAVDLLLWLCLPRIPRKDL